MIIRLTQNIAGIHISRFLAIIEFDIYANKLINKI